jgi:membrane protease YdiL (CAAX protease family)
MPEILISNKRRFLEIGAVLLTALGKFIFMDYLNWRFPFVVSAILVWAVYIMYRSRTKERVLSYWGFRKDNFNKVTWKVLPFGIFAVIVFLVIGFFQGTINVTWHIVPILILYPIWGIIQQFLLIALVAGNLQDMKGRKLNNTLVILFSALLFASVHYPFVWLIIGTFFLAIFYGFIYLKERNIYVLGLFHGWLGGLFYYTVLNRDPFLETFGKLIYGTD